MRVMGILNVTPDSFSDGGRLMGVDEAVAAAERMVAEGADLLDIGGESTRPGAEPVDPQTEADRVVPVLRRLGSLGVPLSVDTRRASVAAAALDAGACIVNDVSGGQDPAMFPLVAEAGCGYVLMHTRGTPASMAALATYDDVCAQVWAELLARRDAALEVGIDPARMWLDPGIGFAKDLDHNLALLRDLVHHRGQRLLVGASRKRFLGALTGQVVPATRLEGSLAVALWAEHAGVDIVRVHDVVETRRALTVWRAIRDGAGGPGGGRA